MPRKYTDAERVAAFWAKVKKTDTCWNWMGARRPVGYGTFMGPGRKHVAAHRFAYQLEVGAIPDGLFLDHLCRNPRCVNPDHLEPVTNAENILRGNGMSARNARKTHCKRGHPLSGGNLVLTGYGRQCRTCANARQARYYRERKAGATGGSPTRATSAGPQ